MIDEMRTLWETWDPLRVYHRYEGWHTGEYDAYLVPTLKQLGRSIEPDVRADLVELSLIKVLHFSLARGPEAIEELAPGMFAKVLGDWFKDRTGAGDASIPLTDLVARVPKAEEAGMVEVFSV